MKIKEIFLIVYEAIATAIKEGKSEQEIAMLIFDFSEKFNKDFMKMTDILLDNNKVDKYLENIDYVFLGQMQNVIYKIRKNYRKGILNLSSLKKEATNEKDKEIENNPDNTKGGALVDNNQLMLNKEELFIYFQSLLKALNLKMPIEMGLKVIAHKDKLASEDIYKKGVEYFLKYANRQERNEYLTKVNAYRRSEAVFSLDFRTNAVIYQIFQILSNSEEKERTIAKLLESLDASVLNRLKQRFISIFKNYLPEIKELLGTEEAYSSELIINKLLQQFANSKNSKSKVNLQEFPVTTGQAVEIIEAFLKFNGTVKEFAKLDLYPYKNQTEKTITKKLIDLCYRFKPGLLKDLRKHLEAVKEYELSYVNTILDIIIYYRRNGYPVADGKTRRFDILDYYSLTNFPLDQLRYLASKNNLLGPDDLRLFSEFAGNNITVKPFTDYEFTLEGLKNSYNVSFSDDYKLSNEEKIGIYEFLSYYHFPIIPATINAAIRRYKECTLFITRCEENNQVNSNDQGLKKELVPKG